MRIYNDAAPIVFAKTIKQVFKYMTPDCDEANDLKAFDDRICNIIILRSSPCLTDEFFHRFPEAYFNQIFKHY